MKNYATQMDAAKRGIITPEMKAVAAKEYRTEEEIRDLATLTAKDLIDVVRLHAQDGVDFVTPAEHLALPNVDDVRQGIIASKIAAHAADIAKKIPHARDQDDAMADARRTFDWEKQWECSIDPKTAKAIRESRAPEQEDSCSMCGKFCAVRSMNKALAGEYIDIL